MGKNENRKTENIKKFSLFFGREDSTTIITDI